MYVLRLLILVLGSFGGRFIDKKRYLPTDVSSQYISQMKEVNDGDYVR